ncbi:MAG TPA: nickel pincer cofactor biosynthesis protein LarC [Archaeoglobaceae archaeon]|nr:nickel pincer cofactor biosynthesis protein LarC [Archaeoglobaceae archaeon]
MKISIFDPFNGAGGDMIVSALTGLSLTGNDLMKIIDNLRLNICVEVKEVIDKGISATKVVIEGEQVERTFDEVIELINSSRIDGSVKKESKEIFRKIAEAEGKVHGRDYKKAVFHEVGSDDAIFDVVSSVTGILRLKNSGYSFYSTPVRLGEGFVEIKHGKYPVPAPATLEILKNANIEVVLGGEGELFTPTAAAILSHFCNGTFRQPFMVEDVRYGAGSKETSSPNVLRLILGKTVSHDSVVLLETLVDDISGEVIAHAIEKLGEIALDVSATPVTGKKGRPAIIFRAITDFSKAEEVGEKMISETGSLGVRVYPVYHRIVAPRGIEKVKLKIENREFTVGIKKSGELLKPEFEDVKKVSETLDLPLVVAYRKILENLGE